MEKHTFSNGEQNITFYEMMHVAPHAFYETVEEHLQEDVQRGHTVHIEGIVVQRGELSSAQYRQKVVEKLPQSPYGKLAAVLRWDAQKPPQTDFERHDLSLEVMGASDILRLAALKAMMSASVSTMVRQMQRDPEVVKSVQNAMIDTAQSDPVKLARKSGLLRGFKKLLMDRRNRLAAEAAMVADGDVSLVWGRLHRPGVSDLLRGHGYRLVEREHLFDLEEYRPVDRDMVLQKVSEVEIWHDDVGNTVGADAVRSS